MVEVSGRCGRGRGASSEWNSSQDDEVNESRRGEVPVALAGVCVSFRAVKRVQLLRPVFGIESKQE